jgi:hypothetical protein
VLIRERSLIWHIVYALVVLRRLDFGADQSQFD